VTVCKHVQLLSLANLRIEWTVAPFLECGVEMDGHGFDESRASLQAGHAAHPLRYAS
jgi:hypothetical protein